MERPTHRAIEFGNTFTLNCVLLYLQWSFIMLTRRVVKVLRPFIALFHNLSRAANSAPRARHSRRPRYAHGAEGSTILRLICFIVCFGLILSSQPAVPAGLSKSA